MIDKTIDDLMCYHRKDVDPNLDYDCFKCNGYDSGCGYYMSNKTIKASGIILDTDEFNQVVNSVKKLRTANQQYQEKQKQIRDLVKDMKVDYND